jgi:hypothetical protein
MIADLLVDIWIWDVNAEQNFLLLPFCDMCLLLYIGTWWTMSSVEIIVYM